MVQSRSGAAIRHNISTLGEENHKEVSRSKMFGGFGVKVLGTVSNSLEAHDEDQRLLRANRETDQKLIESYRSETRDKIKLVEELSDPNHPRVFHVTQCSACKGQLDLPSIHFMCDHSYHQRCLGEHDTECPNCARNHGMIREIRRNNERLADQHDVFVGEVKEGGFSAIATGFSRGIMGHYEHAEVR